MADLNDIKTIVVVLMENRSFDHMLGFLSLPPFNRTDVEGQSADPAWLAEFANPDGNQRVQAFHNQDPYYFAVGVRSAAPAGERFRSFGCAGKWPIRHEWVRGRNPTKCFEQP